MDGPSMLCDLAPDCPGGSDEQDQACCKTFYFLNEVTFVQGGQERFECCPLSYSKLIWTPCKFLIYSNRALLTQQTL